jgi:hypothetical protein
MKKLNKNCIRTVHFKLDTLSVILPTIRRGDFFVSWDIIQGFYNLALHPDYWRFFTFVWEKSHFQFKALVMGCAESPRIFSKVVKTLVYFARSRGIRCFSYIDDTLVVGESFQVCLTNSRIFANILQDAGFLLHPEKSRSHPTQQVLFLGYEVCSVTMRVTLPRAKRELLAHLVEEAGAALRNHTPFSIRALARLTGTIIACSVASVYGRAHFRSLEFVKVQALARTGQDYEATCILPQFMSHDLLWWQNQPRVISRGFDQLHFTTRLITDASLTGWGAISDENAVWEAWDGGDAQDMSLLELRAIQEALHVFSSKWANQTIHLRTDSQVARSYINKMGGVVARLNSVAREIWTYLEKYSAFMFAFYVPTQENPADPFSRLSERKFHRFLDTEMHVHPHVFHLACEELQCHPTFDLFASTETYQVQKFCAYHFAPKAFAYDAFSLHWGGELIYLFPPLSLLNRVLRKVEHDGAHGILIHPKWPGAAWWPKVQELLQVTYELGPVNEVTSFPGFPHLSPNLPGLVLQATKF